MTDDQIIQDIQKLYATLAQRDNKYLRNYNRFMSNGMRREGIRQIYTNPSSFFNAQTDEDTGIIPSINVGRSMVLTLQSKLIQTKGRIFFSPVNGLWETIKVCRNSQIYFDMLVERDNLYQKAAQVVLDALVFELGVLFIDDETKTTRRIKPWEFYVDPAEVNYGKVSRCFIYHEDYPLSALADKLKPGTLYFKELKDNPMTRVKLYKYWDLINKKKYLFINSTKIEEVKIDYDTMPFALLYYNQPIKGLYSNSVMDNCYPNQRQIDDILRRVHDALTLSPANTIYVPKSATNGSISKILSNKVGNVIEFDFALGTGVTVSTPPPIDPSYLSMLTFFQNATFEQEGISQLSAQSKKPSGINSGVALDTLQDVESERFQTQVDNLIQFYKDVYSTMIDVFPENDDILPKRLNRANIKWSEIKKQREAFSMQSSLASALSKDPKVRMEQIEKLQQQGVINPNQIASLLQLPDLDGAYNSATASYDNSRKIIERALDLDEYDFYPYINLRQLLDECVNILLQLDAVDEDPKILQRLVKLIDIVTAKMNEVTNVQNPPPPPQVPAPLPPSDSTMDAGQIKELVSITQSIQSGSLTVDQGRGLISAVAPALPPDLVDQMLGIAPRSPDQQIVEGEPGAEEQYTNTETTGPVPGTVETSDQFNPEYQ